MRQALIVFAALTISLASCITDPMERPHDMERLAYVPVYAQLQELEAITMEQPKSTVKAGKIYAYGNYIFQNDINTGIHIIDNSTPSQPHKVSFLKIPYSTELAIKDNFLYTNSVSDLIVISLQNPLQPVVVKRVKDAFPIISQQYPPQSGYFVCVDQQKGIVVDWVLKSVKAPTCRR